MQVIERPNCDWVRPTRLELTMLRALTRGEASPLTVSEWNDGIDRRLKLWSDAHAHPPVLAELCESLLNGLRIEDGDYEERDFGIRYEQ